MVRQLPDPRGHSPREDHAAELPDVAEANSRATRGTRGNRPSAVHRGDPPGLRKQISFYIPIESWKALRALSARENAPQTAIVMRELGPFLDRITREFRDGQRG